MTYDKVLNLLKVLFLEPDPNKQFNDNMEKLLLKLKDKATKLEAELITEKNEKKRKEINQMLKVIYKQNNKGQRLIQKRESQSVSSIKHEVISELKFSPPIKI
jgi:hypothetical protein